jgi:predicted DNA-binding ArsR family transcriptional regulator
MKERIDLAVGRLTLAQRVFTDAHKELNEANDILTEVIEEAETHLINAKTQLSKNNRFIKALKKFI